MLLIWRSCIHDSTTHQQLPQCVSIRDLEWPGMEWEQDLVTTKRKKQRLHILPPDMIITLDTPGHVKSIPA